MRPVFGPATEFAVLSPKPTPPAGPTGLADVHPTITARDDSGVTLAFPAYDPATQVTPVEIRAYWLTEGFPIMDENALMASAYPCSHAALAVGPEGLAGLVLPTPDAAYPPEGQTVNCMVKTVLIFNDNPSAQ